MIVQVEVALLHPRVKERGCCLESPALQPFCAFSLVSFLPTSQGTSFCNPTRVSRSSMVFGRSSLDKVMTRWLQGGRGGVDVCNRRDQGTPCSIN